MRLPREHFCKTTHRIQSWQKQKRTNSLRHHGKYGGAWSLYGRLFCSLVHHTFEQQSCSNSTAIKPSELRILETVLMFKDRGMFAVMDSNIFSYI